MLEIERINKSALDYSLSSIKKMENLFDPLKSKLGICSFSYMKTFHDCSYLSLLSGYDEYTKKFFETIPKSDPHFIKAIQQAPYGEPCFFLWPTASENLTPIMSLLDAYDLWHGFQITFRRQEFCEMFSFTFNKSSGNKADFYFSNINILLKFINFFKNNAGELIDTKDKRKLAIFPEKFDTNFIENQHIKDMLVDFERNITLKSYNGNIVHLTSRESECLRLMVKNKTCKEISNILNISTRTVELHVANIKQKLGINYKNQLLEIYFNNYY
jgi:DNA-binding CsgD family transcriptional regulator